MAESPRSRQALFDFCDQRGIRLAYVSGRDLPRVEQAIKDHALPTPVFAITDVGTSILKHTPLGYQPLTDFQEQLGCDWFTHTPAAQDLCAGLSLIPQPESQQSRFKISFTCPLTQNREALSQAILEQCRTRRVRAKVIWSLPPKGDCWLLDVLPKKAGKAAALHFLSRYLRLKDRQVVYAGDSGNDWSVLISDFPSILVANADPQLIQEYRYFLETHPTNPGFIASGRDPQHNGAYADGILEGLLHFFALPEPRDQRSLRGSKVNP
jgi:hypothetical protein